MADIGDADKLGKTKARDAYYVTTPIYYVNARLHIGSAYTTLVADTLARYHRAQGRATWFVTGSDEHGQKIAETAAAQGVTPRELADGIVPYFHELWDDLHVTHDLFVRTTDPYHERVVQSFFQKLKDEGYVDKGVYKTLYCTGCEKPYSKSELDEQGRCPIHKTVPAEIDEENYFIRLTALKDKLRAALQESPPRLLPDERRNKVLADLEGITDQSVSRRREKLDWGVPMPGDPEHVIWVWFDALINYISALLKDEVEARADDPDPLPWDELIARSQTFQTFWPQAVHLIGKDILWHHTLIWWAMLLGVGLTPPKLVFAHGWWTVEGQKISKSLGTAIDPAVVATSFGADALRYYVLREMTFGSDGDFSAENLVGRINSDLGRGGLGNLVARTLNMVEKYRGGLVPAVVGAATEPADGALQTAAEELAEAFQGHIERYQFHLAIEDLWKIVRAASQYIDDQAPWKLAKDDEGAGRLDCVLYHLCEICRILGVALEPVLPETSQKIAAKLSQTDAPDRPLRERLAWGGIAPGTVVAKGDNLFPAIDSPLGVDATHDGAHVSIRVTGFLEPRTTERLASAISRIASGEPAFPPSKGKGSAAQSVGPSVAPTSATLDLSGLAYCSPTAAPALVEASQVIADTRVAGIPESLSEVLAALTGGPPVS